MGFGSSRRHNFDLDGKKGKASPKLALAGAIVLAIGILLINYWVGIRNIDYAMWSIFLVTAGVVMLLLSMNRRQKRAYAKGVEHLRKAFEDDCQCCKCQNCGRSHNHWTHD